MTAGAETKPRAAPGSRQHPDGRRSLAGLSATGSTATSLMWALGVLTVCLWAYIAVRSVDLAFTTDESASYGLFHGAGYLVNSANNQWLNTILMQASQFLFGQAEWALRLPNVLAFAIYGVSCMWLIGSLRSSPARLVCFALLLGDPFLLEFFGLARGYGLSLAFSCAALATLLAYPLRGSGTRAVVRLALVGAFAAIGFYANFAVLNYVIAVLAGCALDTFVRSARPGLRLTRGHWLGLVLVGCAIVGAFVPGVAQVEHLNSAKQLYYGGFHGFVPDTVGSLVMTWGYVYVYVKGAPLPHWAGSVAWIVTVLALLVLSYVVIRLALRRRWAPTELAAFVLVISVAAVLIERVALGTLYPIDRTALSYILTFAALLGLVLDDLGTGLRSAGSRRLLGWAGAAVLVAASVNLIRTVNLTNTITWPFDASARAATYRVIGLEQSFGGSNHPLTLLVRWPREYAFTYYKTRLGLKWLTIVTQPGDSVRFPRGDFVYDVPPGDWTELPPGTQRVATLPPDGSELWVGTRPTARRTGR